MQLELDFALPINPVRRSIENGDAVTSIVEFSLYDNDRLGSLRFSAGAAKRAKMVGKRALSVAHRQEYLLKALVVHLIDLGVTKSALRTAQDAVVLSRSIPTGPPRHVPSELTDCCLRCKSRPNWSACCSVC